MFTSRIDCKSTPYVLLFLLLPTARVAFAEEPIYSTANFVPQVSLQNERENIINVEIFGVNSVPITELLNAIRPKILNRPGDRDTISQAVTILQKIYREKGYRMAQVTEAEVVNGTLRLTVAEGTIRRILIKGNSRTRTRTILQALATAPGDIYQEKQINADRNRLARLGIFSDISIAPVIPGALDEARTEETEDEDDSKTQPGDQTKNSPSDTTTQQKTQSAPLPPQNGRTATENPDPTAGKLPEATPIVPMEDGLGQVDLVVRVKDQPTINVAATVGYTDGVGAVGFLDLSENNLLGTGHRVSVEWQRSAQTRLNSDGSLTAEDSRSAAGVRYEIPALGPRSLAFAAEIYDRNTVFLPFFAGGRETIRSYEQRRGGQGRIGRQFRDNLSVFLTGRRDQVGYDLIPARLNPPIDELRTAAGVVGALGIALIADGRNTADTPSRGFLHQFQIERAANFFGGNRTFTQSVLDLRQYAAVAPPAGRDKRAVPPVLATRLMGGFSSGDVPLSEQFFLGGFDLLRGYELFSIRGDRFLLSTAELRLPLGPGLQGVGFVDYGGAWEPGRQFSASDLKGSLGLGLRFASPFGPIRLDAAYGSRLQTYIALGQSF